MGYSLLRSCLFLLEPERAHAWALKALDYVPNHFFKVLPQQSQQIMGLQFPNRIGLAAGFDKSGRYVDALAKLGFGFIEVGTVTPLPQMGNPKPRLFRLAPEHALINRLGFNNPGVAILVENLQSMQYQGILGVNIGKGKETALTHAVEDYVYCMERVYPFASYITINISSPNTPDLRLLQQKEYFLHLVQTLRQTQLRLADLHGRYVPLVIKISPDETDETLKKMAEIIRNQGIDGIIATNTTCARTDVQHCVHGNEQGGLSGRPLSQRSTACLVLLKEIVGDEVTLIGVGGIDTVAAAQQKIAAGAALLQVYTGLVYQGPGLVKRLVTEAV
ncbi:MAG: quinone-dependent dihydroorotate dehydrogenase [Gammaproteobacteria bacterium]